MELRLMQLIAELQKKAADQVKQLLAQANKASEVETTMIYKFSQLNHQEIRRTLELATKLQQTRVYQEGKENEGRALVLKLLKRQIGAIPPEVREQVEALLLEQLEALGEALLNFSSLEDLSAWLKLSYTTSI